jgi:hypothetical protein
VGTVWEANQVGIAMVTIDGGHMLANHVVALDPRSKIG